MALSDIEKEARKAAKKIRDTAFNKRRKSYRGALDAARSAINTSELNAANNDRNSLFEKRGQIASECNKKIAALRDEMERELADLKKVTDALTQKREELFRQKVAAEATAINEINGRFPDMIGNRLGSLNYQTSIYSAAEWSIPPDVQAQMDAAYKNVISGKSGK